jgi:hypothetical protein
MISCKTYKPLEYTGNWQDWTTALNEDQKHSKTITNPLEWHNVPLFYQYWEIPSHHPYWRLAVAFKQLRRISQIEETIRQNSHIPRAAEMIADMKMSIELIKSKYQFKIIA